MFPPLHIDGPPIPLARCYKAEEVSISEVTLQRCSYEKVFWKYAANVLENTDAEVWPKTRDSWPQDLHSGHWTQDLGTQDPGPQSLEPWDF